MAQVFEHRSSLELLIAAVREAASAAQQAAVRVEAAIATQRSADRADVEVLNRWLRDVAQIAAISADQPHPVSKELGARLEAHTASFDTYLMGVRSPSDPWL